MRAFERLAESWQVAPVLLLGAAPRLPEVDAAACNGCGACIAPCPVSAVQRVAGTPAQLPELP